MNPSVAVVILNYNGRKYLEQFLPSVTATAYPNLQIIVGDNASTDDSVLFIRQNYPQINLLLNDKNYGYAGGYNEILKRVRADYFVLLNSDVQVSPKWIDPVIELMEKDKTIAACQPKIRSFHQPEYFEYAGAAGGFIDAYGYPFCRGRIFNELEKDEGQYDDVKEIFWASGACFFVRGSAFAELGGLDADFFAHMEEIDLCWRLKNIGYKIMYCPDSVVYHVGGGTLQSDSPFKTYLNFRNNIILLQKNLTVWKAAWVIHLRLWLDLIAIFKFISERKWAHVRAISNAHSYFFMNLRSLIRKSKSVKIDPEKKNLAGLYKGNIVWKHFMKKIKRSSELPQTDFI